MAKKTKKVSPKKKLSSLILLLLITVVMLSTSTYAWFTSNRTITVSTLNVHVEAQNGLQVSADGTNWKTVLQNEDLVAGYPGSVNQLPASLEPVSTGKTVDATTGYLNMYYGIIGSNAAGDQILSSAKSTESVDTLTTGRFIAFDMFLKVDAPTDLYLTTASNVVPKEGTPDVGLKNAARVAFLDQGHLGVSAPVADIRGLKGATASTTYIWEPNNDTHTAAAVVHARDTYGIDGVLETGSTPLPYDGIIAEFDATANGGNGVGVGNANATAFNSFFAPVTVNYGTPNNRLASTQVFSLQTGITKLRVYMWIEGQDIDCENSASGTDISFNVQLSVNAD